MSSIVYSMACISKTATGENTRSPGSLLFYNQQVKLVYNMESRVRLKVARTVWKQGKCREASTYAYYYRVNQLSHKYVSNGSQPEQIAGLLTD